MSVQPPLVDLPQALQIASELNAPEAFGIQLWDCMLPISGQYGLLPRLLFYLLLCFGLLVRSHEWLAVGALAATMTYSGTAAIHIIIAPFLSRAGVGADFAPIRVILSTACIMAVPLFNWSSTLRRLHARPLAIYWDFLIVAAYLSSSVLNLAYNIPERRAFVAPRARNVVCSVDPGAPASLPKVLDRQWLAAHHCNSSCDPLGWLPPFRSGDGPLAFAYLGTIPAWLAATPQLECLLDLWILPVLALQGYYTCLVGRSSPAQLRNQLFLTICCRDRVETWANTIQNLVAKYMAMLVISPAVCIVNLVLRELYLQQAPWVLESESPTMLGQWSPWVSTGLALLGAVIARYHDSWMEFLQASHNTLSLHLLRWISEDDTTRSLDAPNAHQDARFWRLNVNALRRVSASSTPTSTLHKTLSIMAGDALSKAWSFLLLPSRYISRYLRTTSKNLQRYLLSPLHSMKGFLSDEWKDFAAWFADPYCVEDTLLSAVPMDLEPLGPRRKTNGRPIDGPGCNVQEPCSSEQQG